MFSARMAVDPSPQREAPVPVGKHRSWYRRQKAVLAQNRACLGGLKADTARPGVCSSG